MLGKFKVDNILLYHHHLLLLARSLGPDASSIFGFAAATPPPRSNQAFQQITTNKKSEIRVDEIRNQYEIVCIRLFEECL